MRCRRLFTFLFLLCLMISAVVPAHATGFSIVNTRETDAERLLRGWDEEKGEWVSAFAGSAAFFDDYAISTGTSSESIALSRYPVKDYPKYRIEKEVHVDTITVVAYSNEFTIE